MSRLTGMLGFILLPHLKWVFNFVQMNLMLSMILLPQWLYNRHTTGVDTSFDSSWATLVADSTVGQYFEMWSASSRQKVRPQTRRGEYKYLSIGLSRKRCVSLSCSNGVLQFSSRWSSGHRSSAWANSNVNFDIRTSGWLGVINGEDQL